MVPDLPTIAESGLPGYESVQITGLFAPAKTPRPVIERINREAVRVLNVPEVKSRLNAAGRLATAEKALRLPLQDVYKIGGKERNVVLWIM